ncbi:hypothetical protein MCP1_340003 [Candidatus Terasakiella magnetica]|nr:hypothetical protein MCP1_340003 [Candidatus Terasakiella magnetica]
MKDVWKAIVQVRHTTAWSIGICKFHGLFDWPPLFFSQPDLPTVLHGVLAVHVYLPNQPIALIGGDFSPFGKIGDAVDENVVVPSTTRMLTELVQVSVPLNLCHMHLP